MKPLAALLGIVLAVSAAAAPLIVSPPDAPPTVQLAAKEIRRYVYLRTGKLLPLASQGQGIALKIDTTLATQQYRLKSDGTALTISGGSEVAVLYGAYAFAERLGVRFYLHGDVIPDVQIPFALPRLDETHQPIFDTRGIQPFHDFPDGPDWWNQDDYLACISQLAKMKMNFIGLHCYPHRYDKLPQCGSTMIGPEPLVWLGLPQDFNPDGSVKVSYPSWWDNSIRRSGWPYAALKTSDYTCGAAQLFPTDDYGPEVHAGLTPIPKTPEQCNELFDRVGRQMGVVFAMAKKLGVKTCVGTETPLIVPPALAEHLKSLGKDPKDPKTIAELYEGTFRRMAAVMPADYYWLWTPESWMGGNFQAVKDDILIAHQALKASGAPMQLATCGWELGPDFDRSAMDKFLPKDCPMSSISSQFGHAGLVPSFASITGRPKWAIPWMENDVNLIGYEPWVGRIRYDAADARRLGCTGYMGLHWHTKFLMHNFAALAQAGWDQAYIPSSFDTAPVQPGAKFQRGPEKRTMPIKDYYADFALAAFGPEVASAAASIFASIDGDGFRPDMTGWSPVWGAQGCLQSNSGFHKLAAEKGGIVEQFAALRSKVVGAGNLERFDYWVNTLRASIAMYAAGAARGDLLAQMKRLNAESDPARKKELAREALPLRIAMTDAWNKLMRLQILVTDTPGELGVLSNLERNSRTDGQWLTAWDKVLAQLLGEPLPAACTPATDYAGPPLLKMLTVRTAVAKGESLGLRIIALGPQPVKAVTVKFRPLGKGQWQQLEASHLARAVWQARLPAAAEDFEYYIEAQSTGAKPLRWPATAPQLNQTVVATEY
jgi:hypothetical protein